MQERIRRGVACLAAFALCSGGAALASSHTEKKPAQPAQPTVPPAEAPQVAPDVDIPAPGTAPPGS